jgi:hypothetical protein
VRPEGFEPPTRGLEVGQRPSIELPLVTLQQLTFGVPSA